MKIKNLDVSDFLANYWQKKPLVIRQAFSRAEWLTPDELAGLACEEDVESRIILQQEGVWSVEHGPFSESRFATLPQSHWTLLVQGVDQWLPEVASVLASFAFLPSWRLDDIMVSYAPTGGTVSQHYDFFDVFLIQGEGSRTWQVGEICGSDSEYLPNTPVRILKEFNAQLEVTMLPGDILYIPAKYSHYGVSVEDSLTYSVGFRAPSIRDVVDGVCTSALEHLQEDFRYQDSLDALSAQRGQIPEQAIEQIQAMLLSAINDKELLGSWLGQYVSERKYPEQIEAGLEREDVMQGIHNEEWVQKHPASRFAYRVGSTELSSLFVDGQEYKADTQVAEYLANSYELDSAELYKLVQESGSQHLLAELIMQGALIFEDDYVEV